MQTSSLAEFHDTGSSLSFYSAKELLDNTHLFSPNTTTKFKDTNYSYINLLQYIYVRKACIAGEKKEFIDTLLGLSDATKLKTQGSKINLPEDQWKKALPAYAITGTLLKVKQNPQLMALLKSTGKKQLIYADPKDTILGSGVGKGELKANAQFNGLNIVGKALMVIRWILAKEDAGVPPEARLPDTTPLFGYSVFGGAKIERSSTSGAAASAASLPPDPSPPPTNPAVSAALAVATPSTVTPSIVAVGHVADEKGDVEDEDEDDEDEDDEDEDEDEDEDDDGKEESEEESEEEESEEDDDDDDDS